MGEAAEKMAKENGISREEQDAIAHRSHVNAARAWSDGTYAPEVMHVIPPPGGDAVTEDNLVRKDSTLEAYAKLPPAFDQQPRHHHRRQLVAAHRRRERAPPDARVEGPSARIPAARVPAQLRLRRRRSGLAAA